MYEPAGKTVHCIVCPTPESTPGETEPVPESLAQIALPVTTDAGGGPSSVIPGELRFRAAGSAVIAEALHVQSQSAPRSAIQRLFGISPLSAEAQSWFLGAVGEIEVGRILAQLGDEWRTIHAVPVGRQGSDIDHVVIGPGGVFTINTKFHEGAQVWVGSRRLLVNGHGTDHLRNSVFEASRAAKILAGATGQPVIVTPILAVVAAKSIRIKEQPSLVRVLRSDDLVRHLQRSERILEPEDVAALVHVAAEPKTWSTAPVLKPDLAAFDALRTEVGSARRRRRAWLALGALVILTVSASVAIPGIVSWFAR